MSKDLGPRIKQRMIEMRNYADISYEIIFENIVSFITRVSQIK